MERAKTPRQWWMFLPRLMVRFYLYHLTLTLEEYHRQIEHIGGEDAEDPKMLQNFERECLEIRKQIERVRDHFGLHPHVS